jgi:hypothetical protein
MDRGQAATACGRSGDDVRDRKAENKQQKGHTMKRLMTGLLQGRITRWSILAVVSAAGGLLLARPPQAQYQLGGAWIASGGGTISSVFDMPMDAAGRTAAIRINPFIYSTDMAGLFAAFGADTATESTGQGMMINQDTAKWATVGYYTKQGNPPLNCMIYVMTGTLKFTGPDCRVVNYTADIYAGPANSLGLPSADADGDGFPDPGTTPVLSLPNMDATAKRVPVP